MDISQLDATVPSWQAQLRSRFPLLADADKKSAGVGQNKLVYLDSAASAQKPERVLQRLDQFYRSEYANIHRGVHRLSVEATASWDKARATVAQYLGAKEPRACIFTRGATEAVNLFANSVVLPQIGKEDTILLTEMEHHANLVPWHLLAKKTGANIAGVRLDTEQGVLDLTDFQEKLHQLRPCVVAFTHVSNALGTINPAAEMVAMVRKIVPDALVFIDGAQAVPHGPVDVEQLDCDGYAFSGHKLYGPTGIGVLWARSELLAQAPPYQGGGDMIVRVTVDSSSYRELPERFEAGTPHIAGALGLAAAIEEVQSWPMQAVVEHEKSLLAQAREQLSKRQDIRVFPAGEQHIGAVSFAVKGIHPHDLGTALDTRGVAVRVGHHCCQPLMKAFGVVATARASFAAYNNQADLEQFLVALDEVQAFFAE